MMQIVIRLMLPLLLLAQVGAGVSPGRVLCIAADCCGSNEVEHHDHDAPHHHAHGMHSHGDHRHVGGCETDAELASPSECDCHIHVSLPDDAGASRDRSGERILEVRLFQPALLAPLTVDLSVSPASAVTAPPRGERIAADQCRSRETTRLLI